MTQVDLNGEPVFERKSLNQLYVWVIEYPDQDQLLMLKTPSGPHPAVAGDEERALALSPYAKMEAEKKKLPLKCLLFTNPEKVGELSQLITVVK